MNFFARLFIKPGQNPESQNVREACGKKAGVMCIFLNTVLAFSKILLGVLSASVSILADGFNNLTDCGSNVVSVIGFKMSSKPADKEHPFGHQRAESISAFLIAMIILFVAFELLVSSIEKIINPTINQFNIWLVVILSGSVLVKLFMFLVNRSLGKLTNSQSLLATSADSISDSVATFSVLVALIIGYYTGFSLDGFAGVAVSIFIGFSGINILTDTISHLIGKAPEKEILNQIEQKILTFEGAYGIHDLAVHNYGQNKLYATVHVEVDSSMPIMTAHELADDIERDFAENSNIILTVHIDPLVLDNPEINRLKTLTEKVGFEIDPLLRVHDFRVVGADTYSNIVFDVSVPFECKLSLSEVEKAFKERINEIDKTLGVVVTAERIIGE